eukprot:jgi/Psemu1/62038/gm1.62038_g
MLRNFLVFCDKNTPEDLPPVYNAWAKRKKNKKTHVIIQSQVDNVLAEELGIFPPLVTTVALKRFQDCNFHGADPFDVADVILSLAFIPSRGLMEALKRQYEESVTVAAYNTMISTEGNSLSLKDSLSLHNTKACMPLDWTEATSLLECYLAVLGIILGATHLSNVSALRSLRKSPAPSPSPTGSTNNVDGGSATSQNQMENPNQDKGLKRKPTGPIKSNQLHISKELGKKQILSLRLYLPLHRAPLAEMRPSKKMRTLWLRRTTTPQHKESQQRKILGSLPNMDVQPTYRSNSNSCYQLPP